MGRTRNNYEEDEDCFDADAYKVDGWGRGVAWRILGWETEATEDTEWSGIEERTGKVVAHMVGDDTHFSFEPEELKPIGRDEFCGGCGQMGCAHGG